MVESVGDTVRYYFLPSLPQFEPFGSAPLDTRGINAWVYILHENIIRNFKSISIPIQKDVK